MNEKELKLKLKEMKQELLNLKIAHERGLGVVSFFDETTSVEVDDPSWMALYGQVEFPADTPEDIVIFLEPPFCGAEVTILGVVWDAYDDRYKADIFITNFGNNIVPQTMTCRVVASAPIVRFHLMNWWGL